MSSHAHRIRSVVLWLKVSPLPLFIEKDHEEIPRRIEPEVNRVCPTEISGTRKDGEWTRRLPVVPQPSQMQKANLI